MSDLNPNLPEAEIQKHVDGTYEFLSSPRFQLQDAFFKRWAAAHIDLVMLSHALCEAAINAGLAILLAGRNLAHAFAFIERASVIRKWTEAPRLVKPAYSLPKDSPLLQTLGRLVEQRNAIVHSKITLTYNGEQVLRGKEVPIALEHEPGDELWLFAALPYRLMEHLRAEMQSSDVFFEMRGLLHRPIPSRESYGRDSGATAP